MNVNFAVESTVSDIFSDPPCCPRFGDGLLHDTDGLGKFAADVDVAQVHLEGPSCDHHAFEQLMRVLMEDVAVLEGTGFRFVAVDHDVMWLAVLAFDEIPFHSGGKACPATTAKVACFDFRNNLLGFHLQRLLERLVAAVAKVTIEGGVVVLAIDILEDEAAF